MDTSPECELCRFSVCKRHDTSRIVGLCKQLCTRSWVAGITWAAVFHRLKELFPLQRPTIYLPFGRMQSPAVALVGIIEPILLSV